MIRFLGLLAIIPTTILLTISFFVLFALSKVNSKNLRYLGITVAILLWISAALILSVGIYTLVTGQHPILQMHKAMMKDMMMRRGAMMMPPREAMPGAEAMQQGMGMPQGKMNMPYSKMPKK